MLGRLFKKGNQFDDAAKESFVMNIAEMLKLQMMASGKASIEDNDGRPKRKALGYVFGYIDAALRVIGQDMADKTIGIPITFQVIRRLWPDRAVEFTDFISRHIRSDEAIMIGVMHGGQQYMQYRNSDAPGFPMGLARFMIEGDKAEA